VSFYDRYRAAWGVDASFETKVERVRGLLGSATPQPYIYVLYSVAIVVDREGNADYQFELVICNCSDEPITKKLHEFWFERPDRETFTIDTCGQNSVEFIRDSGAFKRFFIVFESAIPPGGVRHYRFRFRRSQAFLSGGCWEMPMHTITNHAFLHVSHENCGRLTEVAFDANDASGREAFPAQPMVVQWGEGITISWQLEFPKPGYTYRTRWEFDSEANHEGHC